MQKSLFTAEQQILQSMLREARRAAGKTQAELADALGRPQSFVAKYEVGERRLDVVELIVVLRALELASPQFIADLEKQFRRQDEQA
ncbi:transcriptional regulator [Labrys miyagiensis]|uniref:Transcriptional regulator n=1 Tax=Labrys miyagiensis TaxID=346912 RepID=A0ABQ6CG52_9HYPH|nr:helix-turn-helix transcriptional regulator [Labrys miyagiensis]GLS17286.1 transcriptional regulator [Labrys miyagiensis]